MPAETVAEETATQPDPPVAPEEEHPRAQPLIMLEADDAQACAADGRGPGQC